MHLRRFVLVPLAEIAAGLRHPSWNGTAEDLLARVADRSEVRRINSGEKTEEKISAETQRAQRKRGEEQK